jgi:hypothetical protein
LLQLTRIAMGLQPPVVEHNQPLLGTVQDLNLGGSLKAYLDSPGAPGDVLTSQGPDLEPTWAPGGGGGGDGLPDFTTLPVLP